MGYDRPRFNWNDWRWQLTNRITTVDELRQVIPMTDEEAVVAERAARRFPMAITPYYLGLMDRDDPNCPIRRQVVPTGDELDDPHGVPDPLAEVQQSPVPNVIRIYPDRVAFTVLDACPISCRFCFRKRMFDPATDPAPQGFLDEGIRYIVAHPEIRDVLVTGGDPLIAADAWIERLLVRLRAIDHVEIIRLGTRVPAALPQRVTPELCELLERFHPIWINTHFNHPKELTPEAIRACDRLARAGIPLGNQTVLLKGINDDPEVMRRLVHGLLRARVRPYYLFQCHLVEGTRHFRTPIERGIEITRRLRGHTSGLANPLFVVDTPRGKVPILPHAGWIERDGDEVVLETYDGHVWREWNPPDDQRMSG